jgi:hypothetical protein
MNISNNHNYKLRPRARTRSALLDYFYEPEPFYENIDESEIEYANETNPENEDFPE